MPLRRPGRLIDVVEASGLTGRGGAGYPAGRKMRAVAAGPGRKAVVANGAEGEPASRKDRLLLTRLPHLVLDGIALAAQAVGADEAYLCVHGTDGALLGHPLVTTLPTSSLRLTVDQVNAGTSTPVTVFLPSGAELGRPEPVTVAVRLARSGRSFSAEAPGGEQMLVAVEGLAGGSAVIRAFVPAC
jgi:hypothetical protein